MLNNNLMSAQQGFSFVRISLKIAEKNSFCFVFSLSCICSFSFIFNSSFSCTFILQLVPTNVPLPATGYFFYYSLLGNDVTTEVFHDLLSPSFPAERASVRLSGHLDLVRQFFASQPGLEVRIVLFAVCCGCDSGRHSEVKHTEFS